MNTIYQVHLLLGLADEQAGIGGGGILLEESNLDPGYQEGDDFFIEKKVAVNINTGFENKFFTFPVTVIERKVLIQGDLKIIQIMVESSDKITAKAYADALKARNPDIYDQNNS